MKNVFLIGFMGSGKSSTGKALADKLGTGFIDTDEEIEKAAGKPISRIFADSGEAEFRQLEMDAIKSACGKENLVVSVGGGAVLNNINILRMRKSGIVVLLKASAETIVERLEGEETRPLLLGLDKKQRLDKARAMLGFRTSLYDAAKDFEVGTDGKDVSKVAGEIMHVLDGMKW